MDRWAEDRPEHPAMRWVSADGEDRTITFAQIATRSNQLANALLKLGLRHGDQVLVDLPNLVEWWETMVALTKAGIIAIPGTTLLTEKDIAYRVKAAEIDASRDRCGRSRESRPRCGRSFRAAVQDTGRARNREADGMRTRNSFPRRQTEPQREPHKERPAGADLLHFGNNRSTEDGLAHARQLRHRSPTHGAILVGT